MLKNMKKWFRWLFLIALTGYIVSLMVQVKKQELEFKKIAHMEEVGPYILQHIGSVAPGDVLCAFDIDMTLLIPEHPACYVPNLRKHIEIYRSLQKQHATLDATLPFVWCFTHPHRLIDKGIYTTLETLKGMKKIACTATFTGPYMHYPRLEVLRYEQLKKQEISFEDAFGAQDFVLEECPTYRSTKPTYYRGVLCTNSEQGTTTKGSVLCALLRKLQWTPKCIVLVDDRLKNLTDTEEAFRAQFPQIKFLGIQFTGAALYCPQDISEDDFRAFWTHCFDEAQHWDDTH